MTREARSVAELLDRVSDEYEQKFIERFEEKVDTSGDCHEWVASTSERGYGRIGFEDEVLQAHRVSKHLDENRDISHKQVNHTCTNPTCVNPDHLYLGTSRENSIDMVNDGNTNTQKLDVDEVKEMRRKYSETELTNKEIGDKYGISASHAGNIIRGNKWSHI